MDDRLDSISYSGGGNFNTTELGEDNKAIFDEWKRLYDRFPGFVGVILKFTTFDGISKVEHVPFAIFKRYFEEAAQQKQVVIEDYWRHPFAPVHDCWTVASGGQHYTSQFGSVTAGANVFNTSLHRFVLENKLL